MTRFWQPLKALICVAWLCPVYFIAVRGVEGIWAPVTVLAAMIALWAFMDGIDDHGFIALCHEDEPRRHFLRRKEWLISLAVSAGGCGALVGLSVVYVLTNLKLTHPWVTPLCLSGGVLLAFGLRTLMMHLLFRRWKAQAQFYSERVKYPALRTRIIQTVVFGVSLILASLLGLSNILGGIYTLTFGALMLIKEFLWPIAVLIALLLIVHIIRLLVSRKKFLKRLKKMQAKGEIRYDYMGHPYLSVFFRRVYFGLIITDYTDGTGTDKKPKVYRAVMVGTGKRRTVIACEHDTYQFKHEIRLRMALRAAAMSGGQGTSIVLHTWYTTHGVAYPGDDDAEAEKIMIFDPVPYGIFARRDHKADDLVPLDNGSKIYGYTIWAKNSFANFLERT